MDPINPSTIFGSLDPPAPILALPHALQQQARIRIQQNLSQIVKRLSGTVFYNDSPSLSSLRSSLGESSPGKPLDVPDTDVQIFQKFTKNVAFTSYDDYYPYVSRLLGDSCHISDIEHLLAPGLPDIVAHTSGTSGLAIKYFPKCSKPLHSSLPRWDSPEASKTVKIAQFSRLRVNRFIPVTGRDGEKLPSIPVTILSIGRYRCNLGIGPDDDAEVVTKKASFMTSPWAAWLLPTQTCTTHAQSFFAILDKSTIVVSSVFPSAIIDSIIAIRAQWNDWIEAIATGILPDFPDLPEDRRQQLQAHLQANFVRAEELRLVDTSKEGWLKEVWPALEVVTTALSGFAAMKIRKLQHHFGPTVMLQSRFYIATESLIAFRYGRMSTNLYRIVSDEHFELLEVEKEYHVDNISQLWEVEVGKRYEILCTNNDGLWRYNIGDIIEVAGFSPTDGQPLIKVIGRKGIGFRLSGELVSEETLQNAVQAAEIVLSNLLDYTVVPDQRNATPACGFLLEFDGEPGSDTHLARSKLQDSLYTNDAYKKLTDGGLISNPTIRVIAPGTFGAYRELKANAAGSMSGQTKVPCSISDPEWTTWLLTKVVQELW